jgi:Skp family chaperone for outer membrane proteins
MKQLINLLIFCLISTTGFAQRIGYVDTDFIIEQLPQFNQSQSKLDAQVKRWEEEIQTKKKEIDTLKQKFDDEKILYTESQFKDKEKDIKDKETKLKELIDKKFGAEGEIVKYRQNSAKPVQDQIFNAIRTVCEKQKYNWIINKGQSGIDFLYTDGRNDVTNLVLKELGLGQYDEEAKKKVKEDKKKERERKLKEKQDRLKQAKEDRKNKTKKNEKSEGSESLDDNKYIENDSEVEVNSETDVKPKELTPEQKELEERKRKLKESLKQNTEKIKDEVKINEPTIEIKPKREVKKTVGELTPEQKELEERKRKLRESLK